MALGFIRKVFSFGKKEVETVPAPDGQAEGRAETGAPDEDERGEAERREAERREEEGAPQEPGPRAPAAEAEGEAFESEARASDVEEPVAPVPPAPEPSARAPSPPEPSQPEPSLAEPLQPEDPEPKGPEGEGSGEAPPRTAPPGEAPAAPQAQEGPPADADVEDEAAFAPAPSSPPAPAEPPAPEEPAAPEEPPAAPRPPRWSSAGPGAAEPRPAEAGPAPAASWLQRLRQGLTRTSSQLTGQITGIFTRRKLDEDTLQDLEDVLIQADLGVETAMRVTDTLASGRYGRDVSTAEVTAIMASEIEKVLTPVARPLELDLSFRPHVILVVGVNGTGKTTTIGKLAAKLTRGGLTVTLAAGDTFRAAAIEQLKIWGERTGAEVVATKLGADAAGLAFEAYQRAKANGSDVLIVDTAGRLQNKTELMNELAKVVRVIGKHDPEAPHTVLQTLDATTGQNALGQVEIFKNVAGVNGLVMTKLDGTARGGILVAISARHKLPVYFVGVGEGIDDLEPFAARDFAAALVGEAAAES